jgi:hypothetical protein
MAIRSLKNGTFSRSLLIGNTAYDPPEFESISTVSVGSGGASSVEFTSIPSTYSHLQIRGIARSTNSVTSVNISLQFNGVTSSSYAWHWIYGDGSSVVASNDSNTTLAYVARGAGASASSSIFGAAVIDILDYANTNKTKTVRALSGHDNNGSGYAWFASGLFNSTNAISSITIKAQDGNLAQYSRFALYGVK